MLRIAREVGVDCICCAARGDLGSSRAIPNEFSADRPIMPELSNEQEKRELILALGKRIAELRNRQKMIRGQWDPIRKTSVSRGNSHRR